jgi:NAD(P)H-dependent flavin oxidoreductase YrpB (nitropropane dioxygenase family)
VSILFATVNTPDYPGFVEAIIKGGVKVVETAGRNPEQVMPYLKAAGIKVIHKCTSVRHSLKAQKLDVMLFLSMVLSVVGTPVKMMYRI